MCGISGGEGLHVERYAARAMDLLAHRGRDATTLFINGEASNIKQGQNFMLHHLHSVVGHVPQPIVRVGTLVINCEIYNWEFLAEKYSLQADNDADLVCQLLDLKGISCIDEFDGVYAGVYLRDGVYTMFRDTLGVKPLFYEVSDGFYFSSEPQVLDHPIEVHPRLCYTFDGTLKTVPRSFFDTERTTDSLDVIRNNVTDYFIEAVRKRVPSKKVAVLFSGGVDSTSIAYVLHKLQIPFTCVSVGCRDGAQSSDLIESRKICEMYGWDFEEVTLSDQDVETYAIEVSNMINDCNVVKTEVGITLYAACLRAKELGAKVVFSGLGSEEIFAGYDRHKKSGNITRECLSGLRKMYERDLVRDDIVSMKAGVEIRLPFLDKKLVSYGLSIPEEYKMHTLGKDIFREAMHQYGLVEDVAFRPKKAAQYGSRVSDALKRVTRGHKKSDWLHERFQGNMPKLGLLLSGGKDSLYAAYIMHTQKYPLHAALTIKSKNEFSYMFQHFGTDITSYQCESMGIPLIEIESSGEKEKELDDLRLGLQELKRIGCDGIIVGALSSTYQRDRVERYCDLVGLKVFAPCWNKGQHEQMQELLRNNFEFIMTLVAADGLDASWLGKVITESDYQTLCKIEKRNGLHVAGEGGEFETIVLDCPLFKKRLDVEVTITQHDTVTAFASIDSVKFNDKT